ncbi:MAG TPA: carbohydrate kinase [Anaerovoracaceae bacterium]|nr:carbohydrate kinase [Anaerovoracaceae bacterium]
MGLDVICVGEMVIDFFPGCEPASYIRNAGGAPANVAVAVARNGHKSGFYGRMGNDGFGRFLVNTLKENGVTVLCEELADDAVTTMAFVTLDENGERSFTFARKPGADMLLKPGDIEREDIENCTIVHAGSCSLSASPASEATAYALKLASDTGKMVSFDVNYRSLLWNGDEKAAREKIFEVLRYVDLLKISEEESGMLGGEGKIGALMKEHGISLVVETLGPRGARSFFRGKTLEASGLKTKTVDATGAGDAFWGGFLSSLIVQRITNRNQLNEAVVLKAMGYGNIAGALCVREKGAISSLPTRGRIEEYLKTEGVYRTGEHLKTGGDPV